MRRIFSLLIFLLIAAGLTGSQALALAAASAFTVEEDAAAEEKEEQAIRTTKQKRGKVRDQRGALKLLSLVQAAPNAALSSLHPPYSRFLPCSSASSHRLLNLRV